MTTCKRCNQPVPDDVASEMFMNGKYLMVCACCALDTVRELHGMPNYQFQGPRAKAMYDKCKAFKESEAAHGKK